MSKHKYTDIFCIAIVVVMLAFTFAFIYSPNWGVAAAQVQPAYADQLFSTDKVHTIDIQVKDAVWQDMLENAKTETYIEATVVIDGEKVGGVGLRPKGNSSLAMIASSESDRYSMKIEFDHFSNSISYHGLDKLALNNIAQDNTYMKDYITYQMMNEMGADAPLSSFIWVTVNGEDWGLYLAAEGVEESFAQRVYGSTSGEIYKPDMMDMNDVGNFQRGVNGQVPVPGGVNGAIPDMGNMPGLGENGVMPKRPVFNDQNGEMPDPANRPAFGQNGGPGGFGGMSGGGTSLVYSGDDPASYSAIFDNAVFDPSETDKKHLIESLKQLNNGENIEQVVDVDEVIRYFAVHNFVLNSDSYTGSLTHNYYLAEHDGKLSMAAWDYNLAFGGMGGLGMGRMPDGNANAEQPVTNETTDSATSMVNYPIDSPMLAGSTDEKPMVAWIFDNEVYLEKYHAVYAEYVEYFTSGRFAQMYDNAIELISPYVEKDPTAFATYEDFQAGSSALREFCLLRAQSISGQLKGAIASTSNGQTETSKANFVNASAIDMESMGSNSMGFDRTHGAVPPGPTVETNEPAQPTEQSSTTTTNGGASLAPPDGAAGFPGRGQLVPPQGIENIPAQANVPLLPEGTTTTPITSSNTMLLSGCLAVLIGGMFFARKRKI